MSVEHIEYDELKERFPSILGELQFGDEKQFVIMKRGVPVAKLISYDSPPRIRKLGVADGKFIIPDDFDTMMSDEIAEMFGVK